MKRVLLILLLSFSFFLITTKAAKAQDYQQYLELFRNSKRSLNGLEISDHKKVNILISVKTKSHEIGLTEERIRTKCDLRLRQAGLELAGRESESLYVEISILENAFGVRASFNRFVLFNGKGPTYRKLAVTWEATYIGAHGNKEEYVMGALDELLDSFVNEYLKANAK